jgi:N-acetylglucosaminyl-diphospho-decaprenol L-rhamnosyltransferase
VGAARVMNAAAVVVLHDSERELAALLRSLARVDAPRLVVVDTGSRDRGPELARAHGAEVLALSSNPGFGAASNAGLARVHEDVAILLNPDCEALGDSLAALAGLSRAHQRALHVPRLLNADGSVQRSAHPLPGTVGALLPAVVHPALLPRAIRERAEPFRAQTARTVGWAIGACLAAATATLRGLGPFDPAVHLYFEDMELCLRARARGIPTVLHPQLTLRHAGGHSLRRGGEDFDAIARRRREAVRATRGRTALALDDAAQALTFAARATRPRPRRQLAAWLRSTSPRASGDVTYRGHPTLHSNVSGSGDVRQD